MKNIVIRTHWTISTILEEKVLDCQKFEWIADGERFKGYYNYRTKEIFIACSTEVLRKSEKTIIHAIEHEMRRMRR